MKQICKRLLAVLLAVCTLSSLFPAALAADLVQEGGLSITADGGDKTIAVQEKPNGGDAPGPGGSASNDTLSLSYHEQKAVSRDYDQAVPVQVTNLSEQAVQYYLECENPYDDIYMNFVSSGSKDAPLTIPAHGTQEVTLSVFAQNAARTSYTITVTAMVAGGGSVKLPLTFSCAVAGGSVSLTKGTVDPATLATTYTVQNSGAGKITDLTLSVEGEAADYVRISPSVENYEIEANAGITVKLIPDLGKMKKDGKALISGKLAASGGATTEVDVSFDTEGKDITSMTLDELAMMQDGNKYHDVEFVEDKFSFTTNISGEEKTMAEITKEYYDENDSAKNGVDTADELNEVLSALITEDGMIDFTINSEMSYDNGTKTMPVSVRVASAVVGKNQTRDVSTREGTYYDPTTCQMTNRYQIRMSTAEYIEYLNSVNDVADALDIGDWKQTVYNMSGLDNDAVEIVLTIESTMTDEAFGFLANYVDDSMWVDYARVNDIYDFAKNYDVIADIAEATKPVSVLGDYLDYFGTGIDIYKTAGVWTDPTIDTGRKAEYTSLQIAKNVNTYVGGKLLSKGGAAIGTAVADGPGAVVGYLAGHLISGLLGWGLDELIENMEDEMFGGGLFYDIYGRQCTNAGRVTSNFYVPDFGGDYSGVRAYETGRMYDGSPYGGHAGYAEDQFGGDRYIHDRDVTYKYILNGQDVGTTHNNGLTAVSVVELDASKLKPGKNTLVRDYNTNAGHYSVVADTEITILYPADTEISYIGAPEGLEDVRLLPDFAVYDENILPAAAIIGEQTTVTVYVYNRGSKSGWVDISISDGSTSFYTEENVKIDAFSQKEITFVWTPAAAETMLTVSLTNKSINLDERKPDNNTASRTVKARSRQVPVIDSITPTEVTLEGSGVRFIAGISNIADVVSASFTVDSITYDNIKPTALSDDNAQAAVNVSGLNAGTHMVTATITYKTGANTTATVEKIETITVKAPDQISFSVDNSVVNPQFTVLRKDDNRFYPVTVSGLTAGNPVMTCNADMAAHPENYYLLTVCDGGLIFTQLGELKSNSAALSLTGGKEIKIEAGSEVTLEQVWLEKLNAAYLDRSLIVTLKDGKLICAGAESCQLGIRYTVAGMGLSAAGEVSEAEMAAGGKTINLAGQYQLYRINMPASQQYGEDTYFYCPIYYKTASDTQWYYPSIGNGMVYDAATRQLTVLVNNATPAQKAELLLTVNSNTLYDLDLTGYTAPVDAEWNHHKVTYACTAANTLRVSNTEVRVGSQGATIGLYGNELYLPASAYSFLVNYTADGVQCHHIGQLAVADADQTVELPGPAENPATATFTWPSIWAEDRASLRYSIVDSSGNSWHPSVQVRRGEPVTLPAGEHNLNLVLNRFDGNNQIAYGSFSQMVTLIAGANTDIAIADVYEGAANISNPNLYAGSYCGVRISDIKAANGTALTYYNAYRTSTYLNGTVTLTKKDEPSVAYTVSFTSRDLNNYTSIGFRLPEDMKAGEYNYQVFLTTDQIVSSQYTITFEANGGSGAMAEQTVTAGTAYTLPACGFGAPSNSAFKVWRIGDVEYAPGAVYTVNQNTTITAVWRNVSTGEDIGGNDPVYSVDPIYPVYPSVPNGGNQYSVTTNPGMTHGTITVTPKNAGSGNTVTVTATPDNGYTLDKLTVTDGNGRGVAVTDQGNGKYTFKMPTSKVTIDASFKEISPASPVANPFTDVNANDYFYDAVMWAVKNGVTNGTSAITFEPDAVCNRAQMVTFLWRAAGSPEPASSTNSFSDVSLGEYYGKAVLWAVEQGVTNGTSATTFDPTAVCSRAQMATFMFRFARGRAVGTGNLFGDVEKGSYYEEAVQWAMENGITNGTSTTTYSPAMNCTRGQIVTFLYRHFAR